jgi:hypothetical protein
VGRVLKIYTQVKVQLLPSKSTWVKVNILSKSKKVLCYKVTQITSYFTFLYYCLDQWKRQRVCVGVSEWERERCTLSSLCISSLCVSISSLCVLFINHTCNKINVMSFQTNWHTKNVNWFHLCAYDQRQELCRNTTQDGYLLPKIQYLKYHWCLRYWISAQCVQGWYNRLVGFQILTSFACIRTQNIALPAFDDVHTL